MPPLPMSFSFPIPYTSLLLSFHTTLPPFISHHPSSLHFTTSFPVSQVEALTLQHEEGSYEVACNLRTPRIITPDMVLSKVRKEKKRFEVEKRIEKRRKEMK